MHYGECPVCKKEFIGEYWNAHGSYDYIVHTNFSENIGVLFGRTKHLVGDERINAIVIEFFDMIDRHKSLHEVGEFLECFKHYKKEDQELILEVSNRIRTKIGLS